MTCTSECDLSASFIAGIDSAIARFKDVIFAPSIEPEQSISQKKCSGLLATLPSDTGMLFVIPIGLLLDIEVTLSN
jgi:hypothetical protein